MEPKALFFLLVAGVMVAGDPNPPTSQAPSAAEAKEKEKEEKKKKEASISMALAAESGPIEIAKTPGRIRVFNAEDISASGARTLGEFLAGAIPGQAQSSGQPGLAATPYQGGARPQDSLVLLDGLPMTDGTSRGMDLNQIPIIGIDRVELLEGAASSKYGTHAMGGVIALYSAGTTGAGSNGDVAIGGGGGGDKRGGIFPAYGWDTGWIRFGSIYNEEKPVSESVKPYRLGTVFAGFGQKLGESATLTLTYRNFYQTVPMPFERATPLERVFDASRTADYRGNQALIGLRFASSPTFSWGFTAGLVNLRREEPNDDTQLQDRFKSSRGQFGLGFNWQPVPRFGVSLNLDAQEEKATLPGLLGGEEEGRTRSLGAGLEARWDLTSSLRLLANARVDSTEQIFRAVDGREITSGQTHPASFRLGLNQSLGYGFRMYAVAGTGFNTPLLAQMMVNARLGQPYLQNEKSNFYQVGLGWELGRLAMRLETGRTSYEDLISPMTSDLAAPARRMSPVAGPVPVAIGFQNGGAYRVQGAEATMGYRTGWKVPLNVDAFVRNQEARDRNAPEGDRFGTPLVQNRPFTTHGFKVGLTGVKVKVETRWNKVGRRYESVHTYQCSDLEPLVTPTYVSYDDLTLTTIYTYSKLMQVIVRGEHLAQKNISVTDWQGKKTDLQDNAALTYGIPAPKPTYTVEVRFRY
jgi:outer membrane cobalamin receptor